jgi:hypothetical protein
MSHFTELKPKFLVKSEVELVSALKNIFGQDAVEVHDKAVELQGYDKNMGGTKRKAHIVIRKDAVKKTFHNQGWNDIGYERDKEGMYTLWADPADFPIVKQNLIAQDYAERVATKKLKAQGYTFKREVLKDGVVKLVATKYS